MPNTCTTLKTKTHQSYNLKDKQTIEQLFGLRDTLLVELKYKWRYNRTTQLNKDTGGA